MRVLTVASNFPDRYYPHMTTWSKIQVDAIKTYCSIDLEVVVPRPYNLPFGFIPYHDFTKLPLRVVSDLGYLVHYPRFLYLPPKRILFTLTGDTYSFHISRYMLKSIKRPDMIHARFGYLDGYGVLKACKNWDIPLVFDVHGKRDFGEYYSSFFLRRKQRETISYAKKMLCVAKWQVKRGLEIGIPEEKLECIPLGVDINKFKSRNKEKIREEFEVQERKVILFVGQLIKRKGINYLLRAFSLIDNSQRKDSRVVIAGDGPERRKLFNLSKELDIRDIVTFTGKVPEEDLLKWYSLADIFVLPALFEGRPTVINEAMASECAIVATNVSGIP